MNNYELFCEKRITFWDFVVLLGNTKLKTLCEQLSILWIAYPNKNPVNKERSNKSNDSSIICIDSQCHCKYISKFYFTFY